MNIKIFIDTECSNTRVSILLISLFFLNKDNIPKLDEMVGCHHQHNGYEFDKLQKLVMDREAWPVQSIGSQRVGQDLATELN